MAEYEIRVGHVSKVLSLKIDASVIPKLDELAQEYGFQSRSDMLRAIICAVLALTGKLDRDAAECFPDHTGDELLLAVTDAVLEMKLGELAAIASLRKNTIKYTERLKIAAIATRARARLAKPAHNKIKRIERRS